MAMPESAGGPGSAAPETIGLWLRLFFLTRFAILLGLVPWMLLITAQFWQPDLMLNAFVLDNPFQLFNLTWLSLLVGTFSLVAFHVAWINGRERFGRLPAAQDTPSEPGGWRIRWLFWLAIGLPVPVSCLCHVEPATAEWAVPLGAGTAWLTGLTAILLGSLFALGLMFALVAIQVWLLHPDVCCEGLLPFESTAALSRLKGHRSEALISLLGKVARVLALFGPGYARQVHDGEMRKEYRVLAPGHAQALLWFSASLLVYFFSYVLVFQARWIPASDSSIPALFFLLVLVLLASTALSGLAFLLDYYRIPVLVTALAVAFSLAQIRKTDHYFALSASPQGTATPAPDLIQAIGRRKFPPISNRPGEPAQRTLVVVTAAGGGIQAAAWSAQVLTGFDELWGDRFTRSVGLISSVSGGSVGTMYYACCGNWMGPGHVFDAASRDRVRAISRASSLEAAVWGLSYPDTMRLFSPIPINPLADRGWAVEETWRRQLNRVPAVPGMRPDFRLGDLRLIDWAVPMGQGRMPVIVFNATTVETGQRLLISPVVGHGEGDHRDQPREFVSQHNPAALSLRVTTAARLSATFPYVSPISRPSQSQGLAGSERYHIADGGYVDNEGVFTVVDWLDRLLAYYRQQPLIEQPFDRVLVVRIQPFPVDSLPQPDSGGPLLAAFGPARTILEVRVASQMERNRRGLELLREFVADEGFAGVTSATTEGPPVAPSERAAATARRAARGWGPELWSQWEHARRDRERAKTEAWVQGMQSRATHNLAAQHAVSGAKRLPPTESPEEPLRSNADRPDTGAATSPSTLPVTQEPPGPHLPDPELEVDWVDVIFQPDNDYAAPLSWKLTQRQQQEIDNAWSRITGRRNGHFEKTPLIERLESYFGAADAPAGQSQ
jgi:hypothetical protein